MFILYLLLLFTMPCFAFDENITTLNDSSIAEAGDSGDVKYFHSLTRSSIEPFPILMYDTDIGFGYGAKVFFLNCIGYSESFDLLAFNSSKGERWYRFSFSMPDMEARQGKIYTLAIDFIGDYDKLIKNSFFGIGNTSDYDECEHYTEETIDLNLSVNRGFSDLLVGEFGTRYKSVSNFNMEPDGRLRKIYQDNSDSNASAFSLFGIIRYDSRNSLINPSKGIVILAEYETSLKLNTKNSSFRKLGLSLQNYNELLFPGWIFASRIAVKTMIGNIPIPLFLSLGGNNTLRGYPQDRFIDKSILLFNGEIRFPLIWRFGGLLGVDAGKVFHSFSELDTKNIHNNLTAGLRFYMENFVVRLDTGFSRETMGLYFNFGHIF